MKKKCFYCEIPNGLSETYIIKKAFKPKGKSYRWRKIGYCCEDCRDIQRKPIEIQYSSSEKFKCEDCGANVTHRIVEFCMTPKGKFKILCWNCQKDS